MPWSISRARYPCHQLDAAGVGEVDVRERALIVEVRHQVPKPLRVVDHAALNPGSDPEQQLDVPAREPLDHPLRIRNPRRVPREVVVTGRPDGPRPIDPDRPHGDVEGLIHQHVFNEL
jgi:hypothetical protein